MCFEYDNHIYASHIDEHQVHQGAFFKIAKNKKFQPVGSREFEVAQAKLFKSNASPKEFIMNLDGDEFHSVCYASDRYQIQQNDNVLKFELYTNPDGDHYAICYKSKFVYMIYNKANINRYFTYVKECVNPLEASNYVQKKIKEKTHPRKGYSFESANLKFDVNSSEFISH